MDIRIFTTGGSIDKIYSTSASNFVVGEPQVGAIFEAANTSLTYEIESLVIKDSLELTDEDRQLIACKVRSAVESRILITHGTDTMIATAQTLLDIPDKVIVLTGAMQPAAFKQSDAAFNIGCALIALQTLPHGVYLVMNGRLFDPRHTRKNMKLDRFEATYEGPEAVNPPP
jgi:L-asparaginase